MFDSKRFKVFITFSIYKKSLLKGHFSNFLREKSGIFYIGKEIEYSDSSAFNDI